MSSCSSQTKDQIQVLTELNDYMRQLDSKGIIFDSKDPTNKVIKCLPLTEEAATYALDNLPFAVLRFIEFEMAEYLSVSPATFERMTFLFSNYHTQWEFYRYASQTFFEACECYPELAMKHFAFYSSCITCLRDLYRIMALIKVPDDSAIIQSILSDFILRNEPYGTTVLQKAVDSIPSKDIVLKENHPILEKITSTLVTKLFFASYKV